MAKFKPATPVSSTPTMRPGKGKLTSEQHTEYAAADLSSSDAQSSSEYKPVSPLKRLRSDHATSISSPIPRKAGHHKTNTFTRPGPEEATSSQTVSAPIRSSSSIPKTPSKRQPATPSGTPSGRYNAIDDIFKTLNASPSPSRPLPERVPQTAKHRQVIVIDDTDDEDEGIAPPRRNIATSPQRPPISTASSMNSLFSNMYLASSQSSLESISISRPLKSSRPSEPRPIRRNPPREGTVPPPATVNDIFDMEASPNVAQRKMHRADRTPMATVSQPSEDMEKPVPLAVQTFADSLFGTDLETKVIAHCSKTQTLLDDKKIEWGTQFELARGVTTGSWTWNDVQTHISEFTGSNAVAAAKVPSIMLGRPSPPLVNNSLWKELDREQAAILENQGRGLGLMGDWEGSSDWYGGRVQQLGRVIKDGETYRIVLEPSENMRSHRFARFYGSRRFLQLGIPDDVLKNENEKVKAFLAQKFILCGRVFLCFHAKDSHVYLVETNEDFERTPRDSFGDEHRLPFRDFINWHNPLDQPKNYGQVISKYVTRFALGLSNSVPVLEFKEENITFIDDITSSDWPAGKKNPPANKLMTDGCGFINHAALHQIVDQLEYETIPAAIQGRMDGSKGLWILHPSDKSPEPKIWIRDSQNKIKNRSFDRAHRIFDLLEPSKPSSSISLTKQSIVNLFSNGISEESLVHMMEEGLEREIAPLLEWEKSHAMIFLWDVLNKTGNVSGSRTKRVSTALNRALGFQGRDWGHESISGSIEDILKPEDSLSTTFTGRNAFSGEPVSYSEFALELVQAGFNPLTNETLRDKLRYIVSDTIQSSVAKFRIPIEESLGAFIIPDPLGILKEGEIYYRFSAPRIDPRTSMQRHVLEGDVVLGRYPIRLPSDMQKATAVNRRELDAWSDVVIVSTQGKRSLASMLADGDMDGDELIVIFDPDIVQAFQSKPFTESPPNFLNDNFTRSVESVEAFCGRVGRLTKREAHKEFQAALVANLSEDNVGLYSMMHENAVIKYGYGHAHTIRLAYIFATLLDSSKSGWVLKPGLRDRDLRIFGNLSKLLNSVRASSDILGLLEVAGQKKGEELLERYKAIECPRRNDKQVTAPYDIVVDYAREVGEKKKIQDFNDELKTIRAHVDEAHELWKEATNKSHMMKESQTFPTESSPTKKKTKLSKKGKLETDTMKLAASRAYAEPIDDVYLIRNLEQVKAAYAYSLKPNFAFFIAFETLCTIKASSSPGGHAPNLRIFDEAKTFSGSFMRALRRAEDEAYA